MKRWKNCSLLLVVGVFGLFLVFSSVACGQKVTVDKKDALEIELMKLSREAQTIIQKLREKNPEEYKKLDDLQVKADKVQRELMSLQQKVK